MRFSFLPLRTQKLITSFFHVLFLVVALAGIGTMYLNENLGARA